MALRREAVGMRGLIAAHLRRALGNRRVVQDKLWIDMLVQKPDHRGDAVNVVDLVCDAIEDATGLDDRWYCLRQLDWEVVKADPRLFVGIGQTSAKDCQVCSHCGRIKPLDAFNRNRTNRLGVTRICRACQRAGRRLTRRGGDP